MALFRSGIGAVMNKAAVVLLLWALPHGQGASGLADSSRPVREPVIQSHDSSVIDASGAAKRQLHEMESSGVGSNTAAGLDLARAQLDGSHQSSVPSAKLAAPKGRDPPQRRSL